MAVRLTSIYRAAREVLKETGTNELCLTFGMLRWHESDTSEQVRRAPILLVPVALLRNARANTFTLQSTGEDARLNVTLFEKLRMDTGITVPELTEMPLDDAGVDVPAVLRIARQSILNLPRWEVKDELHLGLFSFAKFQMWADLDQNLEAMLESPIIRHLIHGKGEPFPNEGAFPEPGSMDEAFMPRDRQPLSLRVLARRVAPYFGIQRTSKRLEERLRTVLGRAAIIQAGVVWRPDQEPGAYAEARVAPDEARREASDIPLQEAANAALVVLESSVALDHDELVKLTARELGFRRTGAGVADHMASAIKQLLDTGRVRRDTGKIVLA